MNMFSNQGIQPVTVVFNNTKNCFLHLHSKIISQLSLNENQALELSWGLGSSVFLSWTQNRGSSFLESDKVELCRQLGEKLGLKDGEQGFLRPCHQVSSLHQVFVEPLSSDDWEILELHSSELEQQLLNQIRVVFQNAVFPVWVDNHTTIYIRIASLSPVGPYGRLEQFTELVVSPKIRTGIDSLCGPPLRSSEGQNVDRQHNMASSSISSSSSSLGPAPGPPSHQWGGIADLKGLFRHMIRGAYEPAKELPPVPDLPFLFPDSVYRVCNMPPDSLCTISHVATSVIHLFPWTVDLNDAVHRGQAPVTFGLLSKVASPRESKDKAKQAMERKKNARATKGDSPVEGGEKVKEEETMVVRTVCHGAERLTGKERIKGVLHTGRVWIPHPLANRLKIRPHSTVRIKPVKSAIKVATTIRLQPLNPLPEEDDEEVQMAFLGWLHTQSHEPLACLTARSGTNILLHGADAKMEFALTVVKPESEKDPPDQLFLLAPTVLHKDDIQVDRELAIAPPVGDVPETQELEFPKLTDLGGIDELVRAGFEFISHSLLGSPLARRFGVLGQGLQGGALLITGAKGSGKTSLSQALCRRSKEDLDAHVEVVDCKALQGKRADTVRQILKEVFEQAEWMHPSVVLLDDLDHLARAATSPEHEHGPEALLYLHIAHSLKDIVDEVAFHFSLVCLIITSQSEHTLHPTLTQVQGSHFFQGFVHIQPPDLTQRAKIIQHLILRKSCLSDETLHTLDLGAVAKKTEGYTPQDLRLILERAIHANIMHGGHSDQGLCLTMRDFTQALKGFTPPSLWGVDLHTPSEVGLERVGGLTEVREQLMDTILLPAKYPILFANLPIRHRSGVLLYGAPGVGKTLLARAVSKESGMNFISIKGPELLSKYIGASEQAVRDVFQRAQAAKPCILFFDEFDSLAPRRGHDSTGVTDRVVNQLLTQLDGVEGLDGVYVLAASSRPDLIDPALLRPGRLDKCLYCPPPDREARVEILKALSAGVPLAADVDLEQLAAATEQFTGADLKALIYNAQLEAIHNTSGTNIPQDLASGSDSDMSLSSMAFPTNSSGSDDSVGETELSASLDQSMVLLEHSELLLEDQHLHGNLWRLYFGSSYESELDNSPISGLNSRCASGPNSMNQDLTTASACEPVSSLPPAYMSSLQSGFEELSPEQLERLQEEVKTIKRNYRRGNEECVFVPPASTQPGLLLCQAHLNAAVAVTRPSLSQADWSSYAQLYENFDGFGGRKSQSLHYKPGQRVTLA